MSSRRKHGRKVLSKYNKRRCNTDKSLINNIEQNNLNTSNSDNVIVNSNVPRKNVHTKNIFNKLIALQKQTDTESIVIINDEIMYENNISEEISSRLSSAEVIDHICDDNGNNLLNKK